MSTWAEVVGLVLRDSGVAAQGQTPNAQMTQDTKQRLVQMINQWKRRRWLVYHLIDLSTHCDGSLFYTFGAGQTFDYARTDQIDAAFARQVNPAAQPNQPDFPFRIVKSYEEYSQITLKELSAGPGWVLFYDSGYPVGKVYAWPLMSNQYDLHLIVKAELDTPANLTDEIVLPPEYEEAIYASLVVRTRMAYRLPPDPAFIALARESLATLKAANYQVSTLRMPRAVQGRGAYNALSDTYGPQGR